MPVPTKKGRPPPTGTPVFGFVSGCRLPSKSAQKIGEHLLRLAGSVEKVTPKTLAEDATNPRSPLHKIIFDVDDEAAAWEYRLQRARLVLRSITVTYFDNKGVEITAPGWHNVIDETNHHVYIPSTYTWRDDGYSQQVIMRAKMELDGWITKYESYKSIAKAIRQAKIALKTIK